MTNMPQQPGSISGVRVACHRPHSAFLIPQFLLVCALLAIAACSRPDFLIQARPAPSGELLAVVNRAGTARVELERAALSPPWDTLTMRNAGAEPIRSLGFWGLGRSSLLATPGSRFKAEDAYTPFSLLPGEEFALSAPSGPQAPADQIFGLLHWITPREPRRLAASFTRRSPYGVEITPGGAIRLTPGSGEAWLQMELSAPLTYESVRVAWEAEPAPFEPQLWINLDGDVWARLPLAQRVDWLHPADITQTVAGHRRFWIRLVYELPRAESWRGAPPETLIVRRVRIDRAMQGPGRLKAWRAGTNSFDIHLEGKAPELEIRLGGKK